MQKTKDQYAQQDAARKAHLDELRLDGWTKGQRDCVEAGWDYVLDMWPDVDDDLESYAMDLGAASVSRAISADAAAAYVYEGMREAQKTCRKLFPADAEAAEA